MTRLILTTSAIALGLGVSLAPAFAADGKIIDRIEDRIDRRESIRDEAYNRGPLDVIEDRLDRRESIRDRAGIETTGPVDRWERRKIRRWWQNQNEG
ncbi:MAG: hypothetical protein KJO15_08815 [Alphaproteobacteria bacterium]|nr:hypothetical protein [Alphaproteobacteria bacterium]